MYGAYKPSRDLSCTVCLKIDSTTSTTLTPTTLTPSTSTRTPTSSTTSTSTPTTMTPSQSVTPSPDDGKLMFVYFTV